MSRLSSSSPRGVVVLGMHRSGTSLVAGWIAELGFAIPGPVNPPLPDNPAGYHEPREVVAMHDDFLHGIGRSWSDPRPLTNADLEGVEAAATADRIADWADRMLADDLPWVLKDPRMCRLMPLWKKTWENLAVEPVVVLVQRSPIAVAESLRRRDGLSRPRSLLLWLRHSLEAEAATRGLRRTSLRFEDLASGKAPPALSLLEVGEDAAREAFRRTFDSSLVHEPIDAGETTDRLRAYPLVARTFAHLTGGVPTDARELETVQAELADSDRLLRDMLSTGSLYSLAIWSENELSRCREQIQTQRREVAALRGEIAAFRDGLLFEASSGEAAVSRSASRTARSALAASFESLVRAQDEVATGLRELTAATARGSDLLGDRQEAVDATLAHLCGALDRLEKRVAVRLEGQLLGLVQKSLEKYEDLEQQLWERLKTITREHGIAVAEREDGERRLEAAGERISRFETEVTSASRRIEDLENELAIVRSRRSWRYTRPLRRCYELVKRRSGSTEEAR